MQEKSYKSTCSTVIKWVNDYEGSSFLSLLFCVIFVLFILGSCDSACSLAIGEYFCLWFKKKPKTFCSALKVKNKIRWERLLSAQQDIIYISHSLPYSRHILPYCLVWALYVCKEKKAGCKTFFWAFWTLQYFWWWSKSLRFSVFKCIKSSPSHWSYWFIFLIKALILKWQQQQKRLWALCVHAKGCTCATVINKIKIILYGFSIITT